MNALRDIREALQLLTVLPVGGANRGNPVPFFTWVGGLYAAVGLTIVAAAFALGRTNGLPALLVAVLVVGSWALLSGFLHWDGLADTADGMGVRGGAERRLAVMRDSTTGAFGVTAVVLVALLQVSALAVVIDSASWWALGAPVIGRLGAALALWYRPSARTDGLGARYAGTATPLGFCVLVLPLALLAFVPYPSAVGSVVATGIAVTAAVLLPAAFVKRLGGVTGDVLGAVVLLSETVVLVIGAVAGGWV